MMMSGIAESIELCRRARVQGNWHHMVYKDRSFFKTWTHDDCLNRHVKPPMKDPERFVRRPRRSRSNDSAYRDKSLLSPDGEDRVIAPWAPGCGVNEQVYGVIGDPGRGRLREHDVHVDRAEDLLQGVEGEAAKLTLDEVGAILHDCLKLDVTIPRLPSWDEVEHMSAVGRLPVFAALGAGQCHAEHAEERLVCDLVPHAEEAGIEVDLRCEGGDGQETGGPHDQEGRDRLVEEAWVNVGRFFEDDDVASCALGGADLGETVCVCKM